MKDLPSSSIFWWSVATTLVLFSACVSAHVLKTDMYSRSQKTLQLLLIWFVPVLGAAIVHWFMREGEGSLPVADHDFIPQDPNAGPGA